MPELTEKDGMEMTYDFYKKGLPTNAIFKFLLMLFRMDIHKLVQYAYSNGVSDMREEK